MTTFYKPNDVDTPLQQFVKRCVTGQASAEEIKATLKANDISPCELLLMKEFAKNEMTFIGDVLHPLC